MLTTRKAAACAAVTGIVAGMLSLSAGTAHAAVAVPYEPDSGANGTLTFYDAAGHVVTGGLITDPLPAYVQGSAGSAATKASLYGYLPKNGQAPGAFSGEIMSGPTNNPVPAAPSPVKDYANPVVAPVAGDLTIQNLTQDFPNTTTAGDPYYGLYVLRIKTTDTKYQAADIQVIGNSWTVVYPSFTSTATTLAVTDTTNPGKSYTGDTLHLAAAVTGGTPAGKVQFFDGTTPVGGQVAVASGAASTDVVGATLGSHSYTATYYPTPGSATTDSTSAAKAVTVVNQPTATTTALANNAGATTTDQDLVTVTATVAAGAAHPAGSVAFSDSIDGSLGSVLVDASGVATISKKLSATTTGHTVTGAFTPTDATAYGTSNGTTGPFAIGTSGACAQSGSACTDPQTLKVTVATGTLVISTPYDAANPFDLGTMTLSADGKHLDASAPFGTAADPNAGVTITDRRSGDLPWDASVSAQDFANGGSSISAQNLELTGVSPVYLAGNAFDGTTKSVATTSLPTTTANGYAPASAGSDGLKGAKVFAHADHGNGTVNVVGTLHLRAPTSTPAGTYTSVVTFTIG